MPEDAKPSMTEEEIAHNERMAADQGDPDRNDAEITQARNDPAPAYKEESNDPPEYDHHEETDAPEFDPCNDTDEWFRGEDIGHFND